MLNRTAHSLFHPYPPSGWSGTSTGVHGRKSRSYEVPVACSMRRGTCLLLTAAITSCLFFFDIGTQLVAGAGVLRTPFEHSLGTQTDVRDISSSQVLPAAEQRMREDGEKAAAARLRGKVVEQSDPRERASDAAARAPHMHTPEDGLVSWQPGVSGALYPRGHPEPSAEGIQEEKELSGNEKDDAKAGADLFWRVPKEGRERGRQVREDPFASLSGTERLLPEWRVPPYPAEGAHRAEDEMRTEGTGGDRKAAKQEVGKVLEGKAFGRKQEKEEVEGTEKEEDHEEDAERMQPSASRKDLVDYEGKHEELEGVEKAGLDEDEGVEEKKEEEDKRTDGKEKEKRRSSKRSDDIVEKGTEGMAKEKRQSSKRSDDVEDKGTGGKEEEKRQSSKRSDDSVEKRDSHPVSDKEGRPEEKAVHSVYTRPPFYDHPFCLFQNTPWCNPDLTTQDAKSPEYVPDFIRRTNAFISSMLPLPFFYIPLSIPRFWSAEGASSAESGGAARCRFTFTIGPLGPSEEILLYVVPTQRRIGLTIGRNVEHSEKGKTSGVYDRELRMHAASTFAQACRVTENLLQAGLIGWSYAGNLGNAVRILVSFPSEEHAKELMERKELSEKSYKVFVDEEHLDQLTPSEKCLLSGRTQDECEQLKAEAGQKREATITISTEGYAENEVRIPEFVYE